MFRQLVLFALLALFFGAFAKNELQAETEVEVVVEAETEAEVEAESELSSEAQVTAALSQLNEQAIQLHLDASAAIEKAYQESQRSGFSSPACAAAVLEARRTAQAAAKCRRDLRKTIQRAYKLEAESKKKSSKARAAPKAKANKAKVSKVPKPVPKAKAGKKESWGQVVKQSRSLLKRTTKLSKLLSKQLRVYQSESELDGRKGAPWVSIWDYLKDIKDTKRGTRRAKQINSEVVDIITPYEERAIAESQYGGIPRVFGAVDKTHSTEFTRRLGSPAFQWLLSQRDPSEYTLESKGAKIRYVDKLGPRAEGVAKSVRVPDDFDPTLQPNYGVGSRKEVHVKATWRKNWPSKVARPAAAPVTDNAVAVEYDPTPNAKRNLKPAVIVDKNAPKPVPIERPPQKKSTPSGPYGPEIYSASKAAKVKYVEHNPVEGNPHLARPALDFLSPEYHP